MYTKSVMRPPNKLGSTPRSSKTDLASKIDLAEKTDLAEELFIALERANLRYAVVGDSRDFNTTIEGDVDIVTDKESLSAFRTTLYAFTQAVKGRVVQVIQHEQTAHYYVLAWRDAQQRLHFLHPDICSTYYRQGQPFLEAQELLEKRLEGPHGFQVPAPAKAFLYYLLKKIDKGQLNRRQFDYLRAEWSKDPEGALHEMKRFWSEAQSQRIRAAFEQAQEDKLVTELPALRASLRAGLPFSLRAKIWEWLRKLKRVTQPTGLFVVFLGADGSGKSSVLERVNESLAPAFRRTKRYHLRPHLGRKNETSQPVTDPHAQPPRSVLASLLKLGYWGLDYGFGYISVYKHLVQSTLVLFDRYYDDLLIDPKRYRYGAPRVFAKLVGKFLPRPDLVILCDAPAEVLQSRKQEVSFAETQRQREAYLTLVKGLPNGHVVDASKPLSEVVASTEEIILNFMAARTTQRLRRKV
jgi:thymidylate kinase